MYHRELELDGSIFFTASDDEIFETHASFAQRRYSSDTALPASYKGKGLVASGACRLVLTPTNMRITSECEDMFAAKQTVGKKFADVDQSPKVASSPGNIIPALDTHPKIYSRHHDRLATAAELYHAMGTDTQQGHLGGKRGISPLADIIPTLPLKDQLAWDSISIPRSAVYC
jgi:hypothetical protein